MNLTFSFRMISGIVLAVCILSNLVIAEQNDPVSLVATLLKERCGIMSRFTSFDVSSTAIVSVDDEILKGVEATDRTEFESVKLKMLITGDGDKLKVEKLRLAKLGDVVTKEIYFQDSKGATFQSIFPQNIAQMVGRSSKSGNHSIMINVLFSQNILSFRTLLTGVDCLHYRQVN